jgi:nicotinate phosphoribosyltransferase
MFTAADARNLDYVVEIPVDCVASFNEGNHRFALNHMKEILGVCLTRVGREKKFSQFEPSPDVLSGKTADIYFARTIEILKREAINPSTTMEVFTTGDGYLGGIEEAITLLDEVLPLDNREVWAMNVGEPISRKDVVLRITAPYQSYGLYETAICGMLAQQSGWLTAARECVNAAGGIPIISFGSRHVHPSIAGIMDYNAVLGGCTSCSSLSGAELAGISPAGTMPHSLIIVMGDTVKATVAFDKHMPSDVPRVSLIDTFKDEAEESLRVAEALKEQLDSVRLDTPSERGGVTPDLVREVRAHLDQAGFTKVKIIVSGGFAPERIRFFVENDIPVDGFGVGSYISDARPIDFTADLHQVDGKPIAKRGRIPGITNNPRLKRVF